MSMALTVLALTVGFVVAPACAHEFTFSTTGSLSDQSLSAQVFETGAGTVSCAQERSSGTTSVTKSSALVETIKYEECKAFGGEAKVSEGKFEFGANLELSFLSTLVVKVPSLLCEVKFPSSGNQHLAFVTYVNFGGEVEAEIGVAGLLSEGSGLCGGKGLTGKYKGISRTRLAFGTMEWS